jgi:hypothetical protein
VGLPGKGDAFRKQSRVIELSAEYVRPTPLLMKKMARIRKEVKKFEHK